MEKNLYRTGPSPSTAERENCATWAPALQHHAVVLGLSWLVGFIDLFGVCLWGGLFGFFSGEGGGGVVAGWCVFIFVLVCFFSQNYSKCTGFLRGYSTGFTSLYRKRASLSQLLSF